jgi:hypothetical protein
MERVREKKKKNFSWNYTNKILREKVNKVQTFFKKKKNTKKNDQFSLILLVVSK